MTLDLLCLGVLVLSAFLGYVSGFWAQAVRLAALAGALFIAKPVGEILYPGLSPWLGRSPIVGHLAAAAIAFVLVYAVLFIVGWFLLRAWRRRRPHIKSGLDSFFGALFGAAKGAALLVALLGALAVVDHTSVGHALKKVGWSDSWTAREVQQHNVIEEIRLPVVGNVRTLRRLSRDRRLRRRALADPAVQRLLRHPKVKPLLADRRLRAAARRGDMGALVADPRVAALMRDPDLQKLFRRIDLSKLRAARKHLAPETKRAPAKRRRSGRASPSAPPLPAAP